MQPFVLDTEERVLWLGRPDGEFTFASALEVIRDMVSKVDWAPIIWFRWHVPKYAFHVWVMMLNRAPTKDRLLRWGLNVDPLCVFCRQGSEDREHLYFQCCFTKRIWQQIMRQASGPYWICNWEDIITWLRERYGTHSLSSLVVKLGFGAIVFHVWMERNRRLFGGNVRTEEDICQAICHDIRVSVYSNKGYRDTRKNQRLVDRMHLNVSLR